MELYLKNYFTYSKIRVHTIDITCGIGDFIKFFMFALTECMKTDTRLYYKVHNLELENYVKLKCRQMYVTDLQLKDMVYTAIEDTSYYSTFTNNFAVDIKDVFYFSETVLENSRVLFPYVGEYNSLHIRLGDKHLETNGQYIINKEDERPFCETKLAEVIGSQTIPLFLCSDQTTFKKNMVEKYGGDKVWATECSVAHSGLPNTTKEQVIDAVTEFYILSNSKQVYSNAYSGFSSMAAKMNNVLYTVM